jgi:uncharacterized protein YdaU (DUF1376 family)
MSAPPFMQMYWSDYFGDTRHLSCEQHGAYLQLLGSMWLAGGSLPNDARKLAKITGCTASRWAKISGDVLAFFDTADGLLTHKRIGFELEKAREKSIKRAEAGSLGGTAKALKSNKPIVANDTRLLKHLPELEPETDTENDDDDAGEPDWDARLEEAKSAGGDALDLTCAALWTYRDLRALCEPKSGEPCEWGEVIDAIKFRASKVAGGASPKIRSWTWVKDQALAYRDRRLAGLRAPEAVATGPPNSLSERIAADNAESERRAFEMLDASHGRTN